jgi:Cof subfamily protein (haloacid dehalogenase superfamily)
LVVPPPLRSPDSERSVFAGAIDGHLYVSDLDFTLLNSSARLSSYSAAKLGAMLNAGLLFTVASARAVPAIRSLLRELPLALPVIGLNGALISDIHTGAELHVCAIQSDVAESILKVICEQTGAHPFVATTGGPHGGLLHTKLGNAAMHWYREEKAAAGDPRLREVADLREAFGARILSFTVLERRELVERAASALVEAGSSRLSMQMFEHPYCPGFWELTVLDAGATKAAAVTVLQSMLGLRGGELTVFGDEMNDLEMFRIARRAVAVANARREVLDAASEVTESNDDDGVVRWLTRTLGQ